MHLSRTPSQTAGPYLSLGLAWPDGPDVVRDGTHGAIWIRGVLRDGDGSPVPDGVIETWQADPEGRFAHPAAASEGGTSFRGFGRCLTDQLGRFAIRTLKPGRVPAPDGRLQAPHVDVSVFARGLLVRVVSRIYFGDEPDANDEDPVLATVPDERRHTLIARPADDGYEFDVNLQGDDETVFFDV